MSRNLSSAMLAALIAAGTRPRLFYEAEFATGPIYVWTDLYNVTWSGHTWVGIGGLMGVSTVDETDDVKAQAVTIQVSGVDPTMVSTALGELVTGKRGILRLGFLDASGAVIADPFISFRGRLDVGEIDDSDPSKPIINLTYENDLVRLEQPNEWRYTDGHQQLLHPGDTGLTRIASLQDKDIEWP